VDTYHKSLDKFLEHLGKPHDSEDSTLPLSAFSEMNVKSFVWDLKMKQKLAPTSICEHLAALKSFGKYLVKSKITEKNPAESIPMPKRPKRLVNILSQKDLAEESVRENQGKLCVIIDEEIHPGITGNIAGKIMQDKNIPAIVVTKAEDSYKGSMRSFFTFIVF